MPFNEDRTFKLMREYNLDALITSTPENITYLSDFPLLHGCLAETTVYVILPRKREIEPAIVISKNAIDLLTASPSKIKDVRLWGDFYLFETEKLDRKKLAPSEAKMLEIMTKAKLESKAIDALVKTLEEKGLAGGRLGFDEKNLSSPFIFEEVKRSLPRAKIIPANLIFRQIRMVKTEEEIKLLKKATDINEKSLKAVLNAVRPGITERELSDLRDAVVREEGGVPYYTVINAGNKGGLVNAQPSDYVLKRGDSIRLDFYVNYQYYFSDMARTAVLGEPTSKLRQYQKAVLSGLLKAEEIIRSGVVASEIFQVAVETIRKKGIPHYNRHHVGHGIGMVCYDPPLISPKDNTLLEEGTVINLEMPYYEIGWGAVHVEDTILVTKGGYERLQSSSLDLYVL